MGAFFSSHHREVQRDIAQGDNKLTYLSAEYSRGRVSLAQEIEEVTQSDRAKAQQQNVMFREMVVTLTTVIAF